MKIVSHVSKFYHEIHVEIRETEPTVYYCPHLGYFLRRSSYG